MRSNEHDTGDSNKTINKREKLGHGEHMEKKNTHRQFMGMKFHISRRSPGLLEAET